MNITVIRFVDHSAFGVVGYNTALPRMQRLLIHLEDALRDLETPEPRERPRSTVPPL